MARKDESYYQAFRTLARWLPTSQIAALREATEGEEGEYFIIKVKEFADRIDQMPKTYEQDGKGDDAICYLHFFRGACDFWVMEKDMTPDEIGVHRQAFGYCDLGMGFPELGYIDMQELIVNHIEMDLYFEPTRLGDIKAQHHG